MTQSKQQKVYDYLEKKSQILFFVLSPGGSIIEANGFARSMTGCLVHKTTFAELVVDFSGSFVFQELVQNPRGPHLLNISLSSGVPQSFYFDFEPVGTQILAFGMQDLDEIKTMQHQVLSLNQELNNAARSLHKKNAQLLQLNKEKNQFLGMAAHDLRKPIGLILTYSEFLLDEAAHVLDAEQQGFLTTINTASMFMKKLVDDFLDVSAIEAGRFDLDLHPVDIAAMLAHSLKINHLQASKKGIALQVETGKFHHPVVMDASRIEQAITNLVSNAIEHSRPGDTVIVRWFVRNGSFVFSVIDKGPGIVPTEMQKLFTPFGKTGTKKTGGEKSTGLGMMITHKIIKAHNGDLLADSIPGQGTTITFKIPIKA